MITEEQLDRLAPQTQREVIKSKIVDNEPTLPHHVSEYTEYGLSQILEAGLQEFLRLPSQENKHYLVNLIEYNYAEYQRLWMKNRAPVKK